MPLSVLDLAPIERGGNAGEAIAACVTFAQRAEALGYRRVWYAEHHNFSGIASSAPAVLVAHVAAHTSTIRLGAGGVMLPNHSPLAIAEQFGTLAAAHPGRIDLGLGRAPGTDPAASRALRSDRAAAESFPQDVLELQAYLAGASRVPGVQAVPRTNGPDGNPVPLYILGSSLVGASLAAALGLPFAFASHFAPDALHEAAALYRRDFRPSTQLDAPYLMAGITVITADDEDEARAELAAARRQRAVALFGQGRDLSDDQADDLLAAGAGAHIDRMFACSAVGTPDQVCARLDTFAAGIDADELITAHASPTHATRLRSLTLLGEMSRAVAA